MKAVITALMLASAFAAPAHAAPESGKTVVHGALRLDSYAMRASLGGVTSTAVYVSITNTGKTDDRLVSAQCDCAGMAMLHTTTKMQGMTGMNDVNSFDIPPGATLQLKPGGNHIMLMGVRHRLVAGSTETVRLTFAREGVVKLKVPVSETPLADDAM